MKITKNTLEIIYHLEGTRTKDRLLILKTTDRYGNLFAFSPTVIKERNTINHSRWISNRS